MNYLALLFSNYIIVSGSVPLGSLARLKVSLVSTLLSNDIFQAWFVPDHQHSYRLMVESPFRASPKTYSRAKLLHLIISWGVSQLVTRKSRLQEQDIMRKIPKERLILCYLQNCQLRYAQNQTTHVGHPAKVVPNFPTWLPLTLGYA